MKCFLLPFFLFALLLPLSASFAQEDSALKDILPAYLAEMDRFHAYCLRTETYNQNYDCECLSVKFLDERQARSADVTTLDILQSLQRECLRDPAVIPELPEDAASFGNITEAQLQEADDFFKSCEADQQLSMAYECDCLSANFLNERILRGPEPPRAAILANISNTCPNAAGMAGMTYKTCQNMGTLMPKDQPLDEFCTCFANTYADMYKQSKRAYSSDLRVGLQVRAMRICSGKE